MKIMHCNTFYGYQLTSSTATVDPFEEVDGDLHMRPIESGLDKSYKNKEKIIARFVDVILPVFLAFSFWFLLPLLSSHLIHP